MDANPTNRTIDNFIVKLRKKIEKRPDEPTYILTVYGFGYKNGTRVKASWHSCPRWLLAIRTILSL